MDNIDEFEYKILGLTEDKILFKRALIVED